LGICWAGFRTGFRTGFKERSVAWVAGPVAGVCAGSIGSIAEVTFAAPSCVEPVSSASTGASASAGCAGAEVTVGSVRVDLVSVDSGVASGAGDPAAV
jgi:hypothetical protein